MLARRSLKPLRARRLALIITTLLVVHGADAHAASRPRVVVLDTSGKTLWAALSDLAIRSNVEILMATPSQGRQAPRLQGRFTVEDALPRLLAGSGLVFHRTPDGGYVIAAPAASDTPGPEPAVALPEILVTGHRTQNADIERFENDVQPYKVWTARTLEQSHSTDIQDFLRNAAGGDTQVAAPVQDGAHFAYSARSSINLRGLGSTQTLVLVDGRRMPGLPGVDSTGLDNILQSDLNGVPLSAVSRVEILSSTAGGIYGPGATGGVVNVVLKRDFQGAELGVTYGAGDHDDAITARLDGRIGYSSDDGRTELMVAFSHSKGSDLSQGERDYTERARALRAANDPLDFASETPVSGSINIGSFSGLLSLKPAYGGTSLGSTITYLPTSAGPLDASGITALVSNAGHYDLGLSPDHAGSEMSLLVRPTRDALFANVRHRVSDWLEVYADVLDLQNNGRSDIGEAPQSFLLAPTNPSNPFQQYITVSYPLPGFDYLLKNRTGTTRGTIGAIADLPGDWKANLDYSRGESKVKLEGIAQYVNNDLASALFSGAPGANGEPAISPFAGQSAFLKGIDTYRETIRSQSTRSNSMDDLSLRVAGPMLQLPGGPLALSLLAETRTEKLPHSEDATSYGDGAAPSLSPRPELDVQDRSLYAEVRAPLTDRDTGPIGLRGLELQAAIRQDWTQNKAPAATDSQGYAGTTLATSEQSSAVYTVGLKVYPIDALMIRASAASGVVPPSVAQLSSLSGPLATTFAQYLQLAAAGNSFIFYDPGLPTDAKRGGSQIGSEHSVDIILVNSPNLKNETAQTVSAGLVFMPPIIEHLRVSLDYTRIEKRNEIVSYHLSDVAYFITHESAYPTQVTRAALTDADRAKGYTGGVITSVSAGQFNIGRTLVEAFDLQADYAISTRRYGAFGFHGAATWQPHLLRKAGPDANVINAVGYSDGPLEWRASAGLDWTGGGFNLGVKANFFDSYSVANSDDDKATAAQKAVVQGAAHIPSQIYFDLYLSRRFSLPKSWTNVRSFEARIGVQNLFNHHPPVVADINSLPYSPYGDARLRRFEVNLISHF